MQPHKGAMEVKMKIEDGSNCRVGGRNKWKRTAQGGVPQGTPSSELRVRAVPPAYLSPI